MIGIKLKKTGIKYWDGNVYFCKKCRHITELQHRFCPYCGLKFKPDYPINVKYNKRKRALVKKY